MRKKGLLSFKPTRIASPWSEHSAGGYLTLMAGFCLKPRPQALVAFYGYGDIAGPWYSRPDPFYSRQPAVSKDAAIGPLARVIAGIRRGAGSPFTCTAGNRASGRERWLGTIRIANQRLSILSLPPSQCDARLPAGFALARRQRFRCPL